MSEIRPQCCENAKSGRVVCKDNRWVLLSSDGGSNEMNDLETCPYCLKVLIRKETKQVIYTYKDSISIGLSRNHERNANMALNKFHIGKETIPLDEEVPLFLQNLTADMHRHVLKQVTVTIYSDGSKSISIDNP